MKENERKEEGVQYERSGEDHGEQDEKTAPGARNEKLQRAYSDRTLWKSKKD